MVQSMPEVSFEFPTNRFSFTAVTHEASTVTMREDNCAIDTKPAEAISWTTIKRVNTGSLFRKTR